MPRSFVTAGFFAAAAVVAVIVLYVAGLALRQDSLLYFPTRSLSERPADHGLLAEELAPRTEDGVRLHGWWIRGVGRRALLFFHGNAGNIGDRLDRARMIHDRFGFDIFLVDYRGYGRSEGVPSEDGLYRDARAVYGAALERGFPPEGIVLFGESLGAAVAVQLAIDRPAAGVILETPFLSVPAMARRHYPLVPAFLVRSRFDSGAKIASIGAPKLFLVAENDEVVPPEQGRALYERAREPKTLMIIPGAGHNDAYEVGGEKYWREWERFLEEAVPR